jgi:hypothetical protein
MYHRDVINWIRRGGICSFFLSVLISIVPWAGFAQANVTLAWNPSTNPIVAGVNIYYGGQSRVYTNEINAGTQTSLSISNLLKGSTYYFAATTYSAAGAESALSSEVSYTVPLPVNQPPTLNPIASLTINENAGTHSVSLSGIADGPGDQNQTLTVTAISSNPSLIHNPSVAYTSPNASGSIAFTPAANASGQATISVSVNDGAASNNIVTQTIIVTVNPVNQVPTLNPLNNLTINENAGARSVSLSGIADGPGDQNQTLTVTAISSNPSLIPNPSVAYISPNASGSIAFTSAANASGQATISVFVNDGATSNNIATQTFIVTVNPVNQAPTLNPLNNLPINENTGAQSVSLSGISAGLGNQNQTLTVTAISSNPSLIPNPSVAYTSPNASGSIAFTPAANASGQATISVSVHNGGASNNIVTQTFIVTVNPTDVTRPTLSITAPTLSQQWSNATFTATGKAGDNVAVTNVFYSLNGSAWTNATTANNWTNWSASLPLVPGTNSLKAFALDSSGNASTTNAVSFEYAVPMPLSVQVFGLGVPNPKWGSLSGGYTTTSAWLPGYGYYTTTVQLPGYTNGSLLAVNKNYTLTATPAPGFAFTNWSDGNGNLLTNGPTLSFTMAANLALVANFVDVTRPTLSITAPTLNQPWSNGTFTATGKANANVAVANVFYSLNGAPWTNATTLNNWTNWSASLPLVPGTNSLKAYALDASGNASTTNAVSFEYVVPMPLSVQVFGLGVPNPKWGSLSGGYTTTSIFIPGYGYYTTSAWLPGYTNGSLLAVNENYVITAIPASGFAFTNWSDGNGNLLTNGPTLRFTMAANLALVANFVDVTRPTLSITTPILNLQWTNGTFTAAGKANDNVAVANVFYSLNGAPWTNATTANNWTNWSASIPLAPGTNSLKAFALDTSGNASTTNAVSFEYVVPMPLSVQVFGLGVPNPKWGSLSGGYTTTSIFIPGYGYYTTSAWLPGYTNGSLLAVNENYSLTAAPAPGFAFTNWSDGNGNLLTNGPTLRFTMATNLTLVANFVDVTRPTLSITTPTLNQQWTNGTFTATGKANDNVAVATVYYSLNGAPWTNATTANNWTNWSASIPLVPGTNSLKAFALDTSGNASTTNAVSFEYVVPMPLSVQVFGLGVPNPKWGSLSGGYTTTSIFIPGYGYYTTSAWLPGYTNGSLLAVNENYSLTAAPAPGFAFTNWSDGNGNLLTNGPTLRFTMATNLTLVANFVDVTRPTLSITTPTLNQQWTNGTFTATGKANDNVAVATVYYSLNGAPWTNATTANNWTNWSASIPLVPGTNSLKAFALDTSGNASTTNSVSFEFVASLISSAASVSTSVLPIVTAPAILTPAGFADGQYSLTVSGTTNAQYIVQSSTDLVNWVSVQTNTPPFTYVDTDAGLFNQRYYRAVSIPQSKF